MITTRAKNRLYDRLHKAWVWSCMGVTGICSIYLAYEAFNYIVYVRPRKKEMEEQLKQDLLREGMLKSKALTEDNSM